MPSRFPEHPKAHRCDSSPSPPVDAWPWPARSTLVVGASSPLAQADVKHLRHRQSQAQHSVKHAQADLDEASKQTAHAAAALSRSRGELRSARHDLQVARAQVHAARVRPHQIQRQLHRARVRLATAQANLARGQQAAADQRTTLVHTVTSFYEQGDPQLIGMMSLLQSCPRPTSRPATPTTASCSPLRTRPSTGSRPPPCCSRWSHQLARARDQVARKRAQADAKLLEEQQYKAQAASARDRVATSVRHKQHALALARRARAHDQQVLARSKARADRVHRRLMAEIAREQRRGGGYKGPTGGLLMRPVSGPITSPYGYRLNPVGHYWGLHDGDDFGANCGTPIWRRGRHGQSPRSTTTRSGVTDSSSTSA